MQAESKSHDTPVTLDLRPSGPASTDLDVHVYTAHGWTVGQDLRNAFEDEDVVARFMGFADSVSHTVVTVVSAAGGAAGAAAALNAFFQRHRHRKVTVKVKGSEISIEGFSLEDTERLLSELLE